MLVDALLFPVFVGFLYTLGAGVLRLRPPKGEEDYPVDFYLLTALFFIGCLAVALNFFIGINSPFYFATVGLVFLWGALRLQAEDRARLKPVLLLSLALIPMAAILPPGSDAGLYHIPQQVLIREEKIIFGLANIHSRYGFSSILEYIAAPLWVGEHFKFLSYMQAVFMLSFLLFLWRLLRHTNIKIAAIGWITAVCVLCYSIYFNFGYTNTDNAAGILFAMAFLGGLSALLQDTPITRRQLHMLAMLGLFAFMCKLSAIIVLFWLVMCAAFLLYERRIRFMDIVWVSLLPAILLVVWFAKNIVTSGCLFYPVVDSCLNVPWAAEYNAIENTKGVTAWARHPKAGYRPLESWDWITAWWWPYHRLFVSLTLLVMTCAAIAYCRLGNAGKTYLPRIMFPALVVTLAALAFWFIKAPTLRFGAGVFIILPSVLIITLFGFRQTHHQARLNKIRPILMALLAIKFGVFPTISVTRNIHYQFDTLLAPRTTVIPDENFGFRPEPPRDADQCWTVKYCAASHRPPMREAYGYKYFGFN